MCNNRLLTWRILQLHLQSLLQVSFHDYREYSNKHLLPQEYPQMYTSIRVFLHDFLWIPHYVHVCDIMSKAFLKTAILNRHPSETNKIVYCVNIRTVQQERQPQFLPVCYTFSQTCAVNLSELVSKLSLVDLPIFKRLWDLLNVA